MDPLINMNPKINPFDKKYKNLFSCLLQMFDISLPFHFNTKLTFADLFVDINNHLVLCCLQLLQFVDQFFCLHSILFASCCEEARLRYQILDFTSKGLILELILIKIFLLLSVFYS